MIAPRKAAPRRHRGAAAAVSVGLHLAAVMALCVLLKPARPKAQAEPQPIALVFAPAVEASASAEILPGRTLARPNAAPVIAPLGRPRPISLAARLAWPAPRDAARVPPAAHRFSVPGSAIAAQPGPASPAPASPAPAMAAPVMAPARIAGNAAGAALAGFAQRVREAVQKAAIFPVAARMMHRQGRAQVRFEVQDGTVGTVALATSSSASLLDSAALDAVRRASLPAVPPLLGRRLTLLVWVDFSLVAAD